MSKLYTAIGLMSGTSGDGIDASIIQSDGEDKLEILEDFYTIYSEDTNAEISKLKYAINSKHDLDKNKNLILKLEKKITELHATAVLETIKKSNLKKEKIDVIGFHGQTIYHNFEEKISKQLADGKMLKDLTNISVVNNFRANDIKEGGNGAPLSPIYHRLINKKLNLDLPTLYLNIGGISNITYIDKKKNIISFDCGPGNYLIDKFLKIKSNNKIKFDKDGDIAFRGSTKEIILESYLADPFYKQSYPKTLDVNEFSLSLIKGISLDDSVTTLSELTVRTITNAIKIFEESPKKIILCGGGRKNKFFLKRIKNLSKIKTQYIDDYNINGDFIESQAFAYLAIRSLLKKSLTYPETTGVVKPCLGGTIFKII